MFLLPLLIWYKRVYFYREASLLVHILAQYFNSRGCSWFPAAALATETGSCSDADSHGAQSKEDLLRQ